MTFWKSKKPPLQVTGKSPRLTKTPKKSKKRTGKPVPFEVKALALEAILSGADRRDVAQVAGVQPCTIDRWLNIYNKDGLGGLCRKPATISASKICSALEERIISHRQEHPEHGVRRIHDELRNNDALEISPEKIRQVVNTAGLGSEVLTCLTRKEAVNHSSTLIDAKDRPTALAHFDSIEVQASLPIARSILLVDDVVTRGATLIGAATRLHQVFPSAEIRAFALARVSQEDIVSTDEMWSLNLQREDRFPNPRLTARGASPRSP